MLFSSSSKILHPEIGAREDNEEYLDDENYTFPLLKEQQQEENKDDQDEIEYSQIKDEIEDDGNNDQFFSSQIFENDKNGLVIQQLANLQGELQIRLIKYHNKSKQFQTNMLEIHQLSPSFTQSSEINNFASFGNISFQKSQLNAKKLRLKQDQIVIQQLCNEIRQLQMQLLNTHTSRIRDNDQSNQYNDYQLDFLASLTFEICSFLKTDEKLLHRLYQREQKHFSETSVINTRLNSVKEEDIKYQNGSPKSSDDKKDQCFNSDEDEDEDEEEEEMKQNDLSVIEKNKSGENKKEQNFLVKLGLDLFDIFIVEESGQLQNELRTFLQDIVLKSIKRSDTNLIVDSIVNNYLIQPFLSNNSSSTYLNLHNANLIQQHLQNEQSYNNHSKQQQKQDEEVKEYHQNLVLLPPLYPSKKIINLINYFNIVDVTSLFQQLKEKQKQVEIAIKQQNNNSTENELIRTNSNYQKCLQELLLQIWNQSSILKNQFMKIQMGITVNQQRNLQLNQQLFDQQIIEEDYNSRENAQGLYICSSLIAFLLHNSSLISAKDLSSLLSSLFDLMLIIINCVPLSQVAKIATLLFSTSSSLPSYPHQDFIKQDEASQNIPLIYSLFFKALSLNHSPLLQTFEIFISTVISPKQLENFSQPTFCSAQPLTKTYLTEEMDTYLEVQLNIVYHLQQIIDFMLDYPNNAKGTNPYSTALESSQHQNPLPPSIWIDHLKFILQILQTSSKIVTQQLYNLYKYNISSFKSKVVLQQKKNQHLHSKKLSEIQKRKTSMSSRKNSLSSRKNSMASRKNSSGIEFDSVPLNLTRSKTQPINNDLFAPNSVTGQNQMTLEEYIEAAIVDRQMLIQTHIALKLVELLNSNQYLQKNQKIKREIDSVNEEDFEEDDDDDDININDINDDENEHISRNKYKFQNSVVVWSLVVSTVSLLKGQIIYESAIFTNLVHKYLEQTEEVKQVLVKSILNLTKIVLNSGYYTKEFCNDLFNIIFKIILKKQSTSLQQLPFQQASTRRKESGNSSSSDFIQISESQKKNFVEDQDLFQLINGWLEILLTKETPIPEEFYNAQQVQKSGFCKLNARGVTRLFKGISKFLVNQLNFGGIDGVHMADEKMLARLQAGEYLLKLLLTAESSFQHLAIIEALNNQQLINCLRASYSRCIIWYFFNKPEDAAKCFSPATVLMKSIGNYVHQIFTLVVEKQRMTEICIEQLFKHSISFSKTLSAVVSQNEQSYQNNLQINSSAVNSYLSPYMNQLLNQDVTIPQLNNSSITTFNALTFASRQSTIFQELLNLWIINDQIAQFMVFKINGFSHLLDIIGISPSQNAQKVNKEQKCESNITSLTDMYQISTPFGQEEDSMLLNEGMVNYLTMLQGNQERYTLPNPVQIQNTITFNHFNQQSQPNIYSLPKLPTTLQIGMPSFGFYKNNSYNSELLNKSASLKPLDKKSTNQNESGNNQNSCSSAINNQQVMQLASVLAKNSLEPSGIFGQSDIHDITKNSFLKYQVAHPSFYGNLNQGSQQVQSNSMLQNSFPFLINSSGSNQSYYPQQGQKFQTNFGTISQMNIPTAPIKLSQSSINPNIISNTIPSLPPLPSMQYNNQYPQFISPHAQLLQTTQQNQPQQLSSGSSGNTLNLNPFYPSSNLAPYNPLSDLNDSDIINIPNHNNNLQDNQYNQQKQKTSEILTYKNTPVNQMQDPLSLLVETECCNQITLIHQLGQNFQIQPGMQDWSYNKKGGKNKVVMHLMSGSSHQELQVLLKLNKTVEMKRFKIGFNCQSQDYSDQSKMIGIPSAVIVEGGVSENKLVSLGSLSQINDDRYMNYGVKVFVKNFSRIKDESGSIDKCIKSLSAPKVSYIKLRIIRPIVTLIEDSSVFANKQFNNLAISINFLSIVGFNTDTLAIDVPQYIFKIQTDSAIQIIGKLCAEGMGFDKSIEAIANNEQIIQKVKQGFKQIEQQIIKYEQPLSSFLICLALNNDEFADWIFDYLLDSSKNKTPLAKLLTEIIISQKVHNTEQISANKALPRVEKLYEYIVKKTDCYLQNNSSDRDIQSEGDGEVSLSNIFPFIDALIAALRISYPHPKSSSTSSTNHIDKQQQTEQMKLRVNKDILKSLINLYQKCVMHKVEGYSKLSIKLIVSLLHLPAPFYCDDQSELVDQCFSLIWQKIFVEKIYHLSDLMVALVFGNTQCQEWFLADDGRYYKQLINALLSEMANASHDASITQTIVIKKIFSIVSAICSSTQIKKLITQHSSQTMPVYIKIYSLLKCTQLDMSLTQLQSTKLLLPWVDQDLLSLFIEFFKKISSHSKEVIDNIVSALNDDIKKLDQKRDELFVNHLLIPILQSKTTVPICFHAFDTLQRKWLINPVKVLNHPYYQAKFLQTNKIKDQKKIDTFTTKLFSSDQKQAFMKTFKKFTHDTGLYKKIKKYEWVKEATQEVDSQSSLINKLENKILNNPPYVIVIEGVNQGHKCLCGVFSSQAIQKSPVFNQPYNIPSGDDCFIFYYSENYHIHFRIEGNDFGQLDVNTDTSFLTFKYRELDRIFISLSNNNTSYVDINLFDMKPIENSQDIPHDIPNDFTFVRAEYWVLKPQSIDLKDQQKCPFKMESTYDIQNSQYLLFQSDYFKQESPFNFYRSPTVYHFPDDLTLKQVILSINVPGLSVSKEVLFKFLFTLRQKSKILSCNDNITLKELLNEISTTSNGIIDLEYNVDQFFLQLPHPPLTNKQNDNNQTFVEQIDQQQLEEIAPEQRNSQNMMILNSFIEQEGFKNIIGVIKQQLHNWNNKTRAKKWLTYVQELNLFTVLPYFFNEFMKKKDGVNTLFQLLAGIPDSNEELNEKQDESKISQLKQPLMDGAQDNYPIIKAFKKNQSNPDKSKEEQEKNKLYEEQERKAVQNIYEVLSQVFHLDTVDHKIKNVAIENHLLLTIFERISSVSKEKSRKYVDPTQSQDKQKREEKKDKKSNKIDSSSIQGVQKTNQGEKDEKSRSLQQNDKKKKGTGYASDNTGQNQKWNINEYVEINKSRSELLLSLMKILENFFRFNNWEIPPKIIKLICESSLLPLLESSFRSGSLLEICKESSLMIQYLKLVDVMSENEELLKCLMKLDANYQPTQNESIFDLITNLRTTAEIFLNCLKPVQTNQDQKDNSINKNTLNPISEKDFILEVGTPLYQFSHQDINWFNDKKEKNHLSEQDQSNKLSEEIANRIIQVHEKIEKAIFMYNQHQLQLNNKGQNDKGSNTIENDHQQDEEQEEIKRVKQVLELPLDKKYRILLEKQRFGYFSMLQKNNLNQYNHHYKTQIGQNQTPSQVKMVRLAQEVADMGNSLPADYTNSMFVRCDSKRVDVMKCIIMGSSGTPYANGAFLYDVFFEDNYPNCSPKVNLQTTGNGKVRFNPNLYNCGKGTWKGQASENWDPKISTLLQVIVSLQAIIMNDDIYFNEPGYEGHSGTDDGEKKNEGYSNIVRYSNIKYAMIESIRNPPEGFAEVIKRHFYLKKDEILAQCEEWIERSQQKPASYVGLVHDHNPLLCQEFKQANKYSEMLTKAVAELRQELDKLSPPTSVDTPEELQKKRARKFDLANKQRAYQQNYNKLQKQPQLTLKAEGNLHNALNDPEVIDKKHVQINHHHLQNMGEEIDIENEEVKDRWSRYICAMGIDAVAKQSKCSIFLSGIGPLGVEIAKNIVLSGVKRMTLHDSSIVVRRNLSGQFFLREEHLGKNRAEACLQEISQLNHYVRVDKNTTPLTTNTLDLSQKLFLQDYNVVILADMYSLDVQTSINAFCRERSIKFIMCQVQGLYASLFNDFSDNFEVVDKNGEDPLEVVISRIEPALYDGQENKKRTKVVLLPGQKHSYEDGDRVMITQVKGMKLLTDQSKSINDTIHQIEVINTNSFYLLSTCEEYSHYEGSGIAKNIKTPINLHFSSLKHSLQANNTASFDQNMITHDFEKYETIPYLHIAFLTLQDFIALNQRYPLPWSIQDSNSFVGLAQQYYNAFDLQSKENSTTQQNFNSYLSKFAFTVSGTFHPLCAFMGGYASQEIIKAITNKYIPTKQFFYSDCIEVLPEINTDDTPASLDKIKEMEKLYSNEFSSDPNEQLKIVIGCELFEKLTHSKLFMVGSGAIGCELLKNFAMISLCTGEEISERNLKRGQLTLTDPDHIETSNLNRQFLFREEHLRKPKSSTAASAAIKMNPNLKGHIIACLDKVYEGTNNIFTDSFFEEQDIVANALDNVEARRYVDKRCISAKTPLLESGTLGPKGHVQVIIPYKTESYGSQQDPQDEGGDIPHCTLKMFPEETLHCVEWARDKFGKLVSLKPKAVQKIIDESDLLQSGNLTCDIKNLRQTLKLLKCRPISFEDCIEIAVKKFYKFYRNNIRQLLHTYPLDHKTKDGTDFWKLPKRAPKEISKLDEENPMHRDFIVSMSVMRAKIFNIPYPKNFRQVEQKKQIMKIAVTFNVVDFQPSDQKSSEIASEVTQKQGGGEEEEQNLQMINEIDNDNGFEQKSNGQSILNNDDDDEEDVTLLISQIIEMKKKLPSNIMMQAEEFEKDNDSNGHIDFIYALANLRSINYQLNSMDWLTVKLKAGKIVPALATTTAAVAGLQTIELVKTLKNINISKMKNAFLNLAVPSLQLTEPAPPPTFQITQKLKANIWDRWEVTLKKEDTLQQLFNYFESKMELKIFNILVSTDLLIAQTMSEDDKQSILESTFAEIINNNPHFQPNPKYLDFNILFTQVNNHQILSNTPLVRVMIQQSEEVTE